MNQKKEQSSITTSIGKLMRSLKRIQVYALIGKSGSGKSFRAYLLLERYDIDILIDDGLVIRNQRILAGQSAKNENNYLSAVRRAMFIDEEHRQNVLGILAQQGFRRVLVLGTSHKMVENICKQLNFPTPKKIILIENIASRNEIAKAQNRRQSGKHTIPVPAIEVQKDHPRLGEKALRITLQKNFRFFKKPKQYEKSIVHPTYGPRGIISISESALSQMLMHCMEEFDRGIEIVHLLIKHTGKGYSLDIHISIPFKYEIAKNIHSLQDYTRNQIESYTGIPLLDINVIVSNIRK